MEYVRQIIGSSALNDIFDLPPTLSNKKVEVIILPIQNEASEVSENDNLQGYKLNTGFMPGAEIPSSFFEPLPEEDLQAWGL